MKVRISFEETPWEKCYLATSLNTGVWYAKRANIGSSSWETAFPHLFFVLLDIAEKRVYNLTTGYLCVPGLHLVNPERIEWIKKMSTLRCPECSSRNVSAEDYNYGQDSDTGYVDAGVIYHCENCGHNNEDRDEWE